MEKTEFFAINTHILKDVCGEYNIKLDGDKIHYNGVEYTYLSSGLCREVYRSECGNWVLKIPIGDVFDYFKVTDCGDLLNHSTIHNLLEYSAYVNCPPELKKYFAHTELLDYGWLRQEYVDVFSYPYSVTLRELGKRPIDGSVCVFDFDPVIDFVIHQYRCDFDFCFSETAKSHFNYKVADFIKETFKC